MNGVPSHNTRTPKSDPPPVRTAAGSGAVWQTFERACVSVNGSPTGTLAPDADCDDPPDAPTISTNGQFVALVSTASDLITPAPTGAFSQVYVRDLMNQTTRLVSTDSTGNPGNNDSGINYAEISANGRWVVFDSAASNLIAGDTNGSEDIFVHDLQTGITVRVIGMNDASPAASFDPRISGDGRLVIAQSCDSVAYPFIGPA